MQGKVVKPLTPTGVIIVQGEHWNAKSGDENIEVGEGVEIVGIDRLTLRVTLLQHKSDINNQSIFNSSLLFHLGLT